MLDVKSFLLTFQFGGCFMIGDKIRYLRIKRGETQQDLAKIIGVSNQSVAYYEGDKREPNLETIIKIAHHYNVTLDELVASNDLQTPFKEFEDHILSQKEEWTWLFPAAKEQKKFVQGFRDETLNNIHKNLSAIELDLETREIFINISTEIFRLEHKLLDLLTITNKTQTDAVSLFHQIMALKKLYEYTNKLYYDDHSYENVLYEIGKKLRGIKSIIG